MRHVEEMAVRPHAIGMPDHDRVRDYVVAQLTALGVRAQVQTTTAVGTRYQSAGRVQNILAWLPGSDSKGKALLVVAHYDGVQAGPAAGDDAAGVAAILETVRALRARKTPLKHDVIFLVTDGEEAGLLGAAAFVREHPWAKDVAFAINFEGRGTTGRSFMFETGPGDLAAVRALHRVRGATTGSVFTTVYRTLPNDTDLSELFVLGVPALNFAFVSGVERYHTTSDDIAHLDTGSVQHHGSQMLGLVRELAGAELPLTKTGDGVYFDFPGIGMVIYPMSLAMPFALFALVLAGIAAVRQKRDALVGFFVALVAVAASAFVARFAGDTMRMLHGKLPWASAAEWSPIYGAAVACLALAVTFALAGFANRRANARGLAAGALVVWAVFAVLVALKAPGASYLFTWPTVFGAIAALVPERFRSLALWVSAAITLLMIAGLTYGVSVVILGVFGVGALALGLFASLVALLLMPLLQLVFGESRFGGAALMLLGAVVLAAIGAFTVRRSPAHPIRTALVYAQNADSADAWFGTSAPLRDAWTRSAVGPTTTPPGWTSRLPGGRFIGHKVERVAMDAPNVALVRDTLLGDARRVVFRVTAPRQASEVAMRVSGGPVLSSSIDGRVVDTTRYRRRAPGWALDYSAVPDSGAIVALSIPPGKPITFEILAFIPGLPVIPGVSIPARPSGVVPSQRGDATYIYKRLTF